VHTPRQAQGELGRLLYSGSDGVAEDLGRAIKLLEKASEQGYLRASYNLAVLIAEGKGAPKYPPKSKAATSKSHELIRLAADKGLPDAQHALSTWYERGSDAVKQDARKAAQWGRKAAEGGYIGAMHNLGLRLQFGEGGERVNVGEAISWFAKAAAAGELESYVALGNAYLARDGQGDKEAAFDAFHKAAEGGHSIAMFNTAVCHDAAIGTRQ
jgi:TPR repeat protein